MDPQPAAHSRGGQATTLPRQIASAYRASARLRNGKLSCFLDAGAWAHLVGAKTALETTKLALADGHEVKQGRTETLRVRRVGDGSQSCKRDVHISQPRARLSEVILAASEN